MTINCFFNTNRETCHVCQKPNKGIFTFTSDELGWNWRNVCPFCLPEILSKADVTPLIWNVLIDTAEPKKI